MADRSELLARYYVAKAADIYDLRRLKTRQATARRLAELKRKALAVPAGKRNQTNAAYRRVWLNHKLLATKSLLCGYQGAPPPTIAPYVALKRFQLEASEKYEWERETAEERAAAKAGHTLPLLEVMFLDKSDDQLRAIVESVEALQLINNGEAGT
jgi:hypothetical protein